jgi:hypothetical protein
MAAKVAPAAAVEYRVSVMDLIKQPPPGLNRKFYASAKGEKTMIAML